MDVRKKIKRFKKKNNKIMRKNKCNNQYFFEEKFGKRKKILIPTVEI